MGSILAIAIVAVAIVIGLRALARRRGGGRSGFKCRNCEHMRRLFDDGVMCGYESREVFKTRAHIAMCPDWTPRRTARRER